jgi:hypothetical protein
VARVGPTWSGSTRCAVTGSRTCGRPVGRARFRRGRRRRAGVVSARVHATDRFGSGGLASVKAEGELGCLSWLWPRSEPRSERLCDDGREGAHGEVLARPSAPSACWPGGQAVPTRRVASVALRRSRCVGRAASVALRRSRCVGSCLFGRVVLLSVRKAGVPLRGACGFGPLHAAGGAACSGPRGSGSCGQQPGASLDPATPPAHARSRMRQELRGNHGKAKSR